MTFPNIEALIVYQNNEIVPNGVQHITGSIMNDACNGYTDFIKKSILNIDKAELFSAGGVITITRAFNVVLTTTPVSLQWDEIWQNEFYIVNTNAEVIPLAAGFVYYDTSLNPITEIAANSVLHIAKSTNDLWIQVSSVSSIGPPPDDPNQTEVLTGGEWMWSGTGLIFNVSAATYVIGGVHHTYAGGQVTFDPSDPILPRIDVGAFDATGAIKITGTPSATPQEPTINPLTQIRRTIVSILAGATTPDGITQTVIYDENLGTGGGEWDATTTGTVAFGNTAAPYHLTKAALVTVLSSSQRIDFTNNAVVFAANFNILALFIRLETGLPSDVSLNIQLNNGSTVISKVLTLFDYGLSPSIVGSYQIVIIPMGDFAATSFSFDSVRITKTGTSAVPNLYIDYVQFQFGIESISGTRRERFGIEDNFSTGNRLFNLNGNTFYLMAGATQGPTYVPLEIDTDEVGKGLRFVMNRTGNNEVVLNMTVFRGGFNMPRFGVDGYGEIFLTPETYLSVDPGVIKMVGDTSGTVVMQVQAAAGAYNFNLPITAGSAGQVLTSGGGGAAPMTWSNPGGAVPISSLLAATAINTINNAAFKQEWDWNSLTTGTGLNLTSNSLSSGILVDIGVTSTAADSNAQTALRVYTNGVNAAASQTTFAAVFNNGNNGTTSTNIAGYFTSSGGTNNYAIVVPINGGKVGIGSSAPSALLTLGTAGSLAGTFSVAGLTSGVITFQPQAAAGTYNWNFPTTAGTAGQVLTSQGGVGAAMTWTTPSTVATAVPISGLTAGTGTNTINSGNFAQVWQWNTLAGVSALKLSTTSTVAGSQKLLEISLSGDNSTDNATTYGVYVNNTHSGGSTSNVGVYANASGAGSGNTGVVANGDIGVDATGSTAIKAVGGTRGITAEGDIGLFVTGHSNVLFPALWAQGPTESSGAAIEGHATNAQYSILALNTNAINNSVLVGLGVQRDLSAGTAATGIGAAIEYYIQTDAGVVDTATSLVSTWTTPTFGSPTSRFEIWGKNAGTLALKLAINGNGPVGIQTASPTAWMHLGAGTTAFAQLRLAPGVAPSAPNDGDIYYTNTADRLMFFKNATACEIISASAVTTEAIVSDTSLTVTFNGTTYKLLARA